MMGHQSRQMAMLFVDIESLIPETHLLRKIERMVPVYFFPGRNGGELGRSPVKRPLRTSIGTADAARPLI